MAWHRKPAIIIIIIIIPITITIIIIITITITVTVTVTVIVIVIIIIIINIITRRFTHNKTLDSDKFSARLFDHVDDQLQLSNYLKFL